MRTLVYIGPFDEVEIGVTGQVVKHGEEVEVEDNDLAESLLQQTDNWAPPAKAAKKFDKEG